MILIKNKEDVLDALWAINNSWIECHVDLKVWAEYFGLTETEARYLLTTIQSVNMNKGKVE